MTRTRRWLIVLGVMVIAALMAFPLRPTIYETVVIPLAFIFWEIGLLYRSLSQIIWWWLIVAIVIFMLAISLLPKFESSRKDDSKSKPRLGQIEDLAV